MGDQTKIEWCDMTFNPWIGCVKVSAGCASCYAENMMDKRYGRVKWGVNGTRSRTSKSYWRKPLAWNKKAEKEGRRLRVFCASLADVFEDRPELAEWRADLFALIDATPNLDWLLLTKRPENIKRLWPGGWNDDQWVKKNVWLGTSVENQEMADKRVPELLSVHAAVHFLSCEPLLDELDLFNVDGDIAVELSDKMPHSPLFPADLIDLVIVGGESGHLARRFDLPWAYSLVADCKEVGVPVFVKQLGENPTSVPVGHIITGKGGDLNEWPLDLRVREFPV